MIDIFNLYVDILCDSLDLRTAHLIGVETSFVMKKIRYFKRDVICVRESYDSSSIKRVHQFPIILTVNQKSIRLLRSKYNVDVN